MAENECSTSGKTTDGNGRKKQNFGKNTTLRMNRKE
jgi:hypothetical protein